MLFRMVNAVLLALAVLVAGGCGKKETSGPLPSKASGQEATPAPAPEAEAAPGESGGDPSLDTVVVRVEGMT